jgi:RNA polymerase sigma-70 factor (ECF subfamily)
MMSATLDTHALGRLVSEAQQGDRTAADRLVREHERWVRSVVYAVTGRAELVEDIAQQVWSRAWQRLGSLRDPERIRPWLYNIARNAAIDAGIAAKRTRRAEGTELTVEPPAQERRTSPLASAMAGETSAKLLRAVESLPAIYREPFVLRHLEDWSYAQIADVLNLTTETVETRLVRARRMLRDMLQGEVTP